ncbi:VRR-NUC domain-containing protein [Bradyrhizobium elkanii]|uniref:VRR-NUC domain-containing protein n=1 Tax=Bradyrhizobium elkanii TaxID=29448 RepID=UPI000484B69E|nr:VRR-NUC domain-containing protein [Bradyrhizobium elkanii]
MKNSQPAIPLPPPVRVGKSKSRNRSYLGAPSEHQLQVRVLEILAYTKRPEIFVFAIPNQSNRHIRNAVRMKAEGLRSGIADLCILFPRDEGSVAWLELKKRGGSLTDEQKGFRAICQRLGIRWAVAKSVEEALAVLQGWGVLKPGVVIL